MSKNIYVRDLDVAQLRIARTDLFGALLGTMETGARKHAEETLATVEGELFRRYREGELNGER